MGLGHRHHPEPLTLPTLNSEEALLTYIHRHCCEPTQRIDFQTRVSGKGAVVMTCAGPVEKVRLDNEQLLADGRFVIARTEGISYKMRRVAKSWFRSKLAGERLARFYEGTGSILVCSYPYWRLRLSTNPPRKYSTNRANQSMPYAWRPGGIFADLILLRKQSCVVLP